MMSSTAEENNSNENEALVSCHLTKCSWNFLLLDFRAKRMECVGPDCNPRSLVCSKGVLKKPRGFLRTPGCGIVPAQHHPGVIGPRMQTELGQCCPNSAGAQLVHTKKMPMRSAAKWLIAIPVLEQQSLSKHHDTLETLAVS